MSDLKPSSIPVSFSNRQVKDEARSRIEGRDVLVPETWIKIRLGSDTLKRPVTDADREKYRFEYEAFRDGKANPGTPIRLLIESDAKSADPVTNEDIAVQLEADFGIVTVEQLRDYPDGMLWIMGGRSIQRRAREFLESQKVRAAEEVVQRRDTDADALRAQVTAQSDAIAELKAQIANLLQTKQGENT